MKDIKNYNFEDFILDESFSNFAKGLNKEDVKLWEEWMNKNYDNKQIAFEAKTSIKSLNFKKENLPNEFINNEWSRLSKQLNINKDKFHTIGKSKHIIKTWHFVAAIVIFFAIMGGILLTNKAIITKAKLAVTEIIVPHGQIKNILLPDSTIVYLNAGTKLSYYEDYGKKVREVYLEGEAYFDVIYNKNKPFIIQTCENKIKVLGTAFNVSAYLNDNIHQTSLVRGKISIAHNGGNESVMSPNQNYLLIRNKNESKIYKVENINKYSSWKDGAIFFRNQRFLDITRRLERTHNLVFKHYNKEVLNLRYTGKFSINDDISKILNIIKLTTPLEYEIKNDTVIIR